MGQLFIPQVTAGRELELLLFTKQQRNMVDMPTFLPEIGIFRANVFIPLEDMDLRLSDKAG